MISAVVVISQVGMVINLYPDRSPNEESVATNIDLSRELHRYRECSSKIMGV